MSPKVPFFKDPTRYPKILDYTLVDHVLIQQYVFLNSCLYTWAFFSNALPL